jgi:DNA-binding transcriptional LysR family regulator
MQSADLEFFAAVSRAASIGGAAAKLNTVQSNVTNRIKKLEIDLGVTLFERHSRGVKLTSAGERLLPFATEIGRLLREARFSVLASDSPQGPLAIGAMETTTALRIGDRLADFSANYPNVDLSLRTGTTAELVEQVLQQQLEGAFVCGPIAHTRLVARLAFLENLVLIAGPDCASLDVLTERGQTNILVLRRGCSYRQRLTQILARRGIAVARTMEYGSIDALVACASAGMGVTLLPVDLIEFYRKKYLMSVIELPEDEARAETVFIRRAQAFVSPALTAFFNSFTPT